MNNLFGITPDKFSDYAVSIGMVLGKVIVVIVLYMIIKRVCNFILDRWAHNAKKIERKVSSDNNSRIDTIVSIFKSLVSFVLSFLAVVMSLSFLGINIAPILATASVAGLAIGFGAQKIVKDVVTGIIILLENQYIVGERVSMSGFTGEVLELGIRATVVKGDNGEICTISNGDIVNVTNYSRGYVEKDVSLKDTV